MHKKGILVILVAVLCLLGAAGNRAEAVDFDMDRANFFGRVDNIEIYYHDAWSGSYTNNAGWRQCGVVVYEKNLKDHSSSYTYIVNGIYKPGEPLIYNIYGFGSVRLDYGYEEPMNVEGAKVDDKGNLLGGTNGRNIIVPRLLRKACGESAAPPMALPQDVARNAPCPLSQEKGYQHVGRYEDYDVYCVPIEYIKPEAGNGGRETFKAEVYFEHTKDHLRSGVLQYAWQYTSNGRMYYKHRPVREIARKFRLFEMFDCYDDRGYNAGFAGYEILSQEDIDTIATGSDLWRRMERAHMQFQKEQMQLMKMMEQAFDKSIRMQPYGEGHKFAWD